MSDSNFPKRVLEPLLEIFAFSWWGGGGGEKGEGGGNLVDAPLLNPLTLR